MLAGKCARVGPGEDLLRGDFVRRLGGAFANLRHDLPADAPRETVIAAGIEYFTEQRDAAVKRERREQVFGRNRR